MTAILEDRRLTKPGQLVHEFKIGVKSVKNIIHDHIHIENVSSCKAYAKPFGLCMRPEVFMILGALQKSNSFLK